MSGFVGKLIWDQDLAEELIAGETDRVIRNQELEGRSIMGEDYISRGMIVGWLDNWETFSIGEPEDDGEYAVDQKGTYGGNSGTKTDDGISLGYLNVVMMQEAISGLEDEEVRGEMIKWTQGKESMLRMEGVNSIWKRINGIRS